MRAFRGAALQRPLARWYAQVTVKEPVILPFVFLLSFLVTLVLFSALDILHAWASLAVSEPFGFSFVLRQFPESAFHATVASVVTAVLLAGLRAARRHVSRFLCLAICLVASYVVLVNGMILFHALAARVRPPQVSAVQYMAPDSLQRVGDAVIDARSASGDTLRGVLVSAGGHLSVYPTARISTDHDALTIQLAGGRASFSRPLEASAGTVFQPDRMTAVFLQDIDTLTGDFDTLLSRSLGEFFVACFALLLLCSASMALLRLTSWPLLNVMVLIIAVRGYFSLYHFVSVTLRPEVARAIADPVVARLFPSAALAVLALLLLLVDILFLPVDRWGKAETP